METIAGIFDSRTTAERVIQELHSLGIPNDRIAFLTPGMSVEQVEQEVPTTDTEGTGEGRAMGGAVGGAMGVAGGASLGLAAASLLVPGVGPVIAGGLLGAALLGAGGTMTGMAVGKALDEALVDGLPHDELYLYEHALRQGRSVVIAFAENDESAEHVREAFENARAESIDAAGENWWRQLRAAQEADYKSRGGDFESDEVSYRRGFEAALNSKMRGRPYDEAAPELNKLFGETAGDQAFRVGYERGAAYDKGLREKHNS
jgi:hypothetical protein